MNKDTARFALETAMKNGADHCRVLHIQGNDKSLSYLNGEMENIHSSASSMLRLNIFTEGRYGIFITNRTSREELQTFIRNCITSCRLLAPDESYTLPDSSLYYDGKGEDLDICDPHIGSHSTERKKDLIRDCFAEIEDSSNLLVSASCDYQESLVDQCILDTQGLDVEELRSSFSIGCECTVKGKGDARPQNSWGEQSVRLDTLAAGSGRKAFRRAAAMADAGRIKSGRYDVVIENTVSVKMIGAVMDALTGNAQYHRKTFLPDSIGRKLFPEMLSVSDNPHEKGSPGASYFDAEGVATHEWNFIRDGVVTEYLAETYYANKLHIRRTISSPCQLAFTKNSGIGQKEMLERLEHCILITGFNGGNSNPLTGDFSYGIEGFYCENGERCKAIKEMNITGNFLSLWHNCLYIGNDPLLTDIWRVPTLAFADVDMSGN